MFDDLLGNMQAQQEQMQKKLKTIIVNHSQNGINVDMNAAKEVVNIELPENLLSVENKEELQDMLIVCLNNALLKAEEVQSKESSSMINDMLPGGIGSLGGMFGK